MFPNLGASIPCSMKPYILTIFQVRPRLLSQYLSLQTQKKGELKCSPFLLSKIQLIQKQHPIWDELAY